jgi:pyrimidine-nucleoside phosphorylase
MTLTDPRSVVEVKRDGGVVPDQAMRDFVIGFGHGDIPDYLASAFLMACYLRGLTSEELLSMTRAMVDSGETLSFSGIDRPVVDKHSTGGVSDSVTLVFVPLAAAMGLAVAKLSGRGLGHTGGTLDKLEAIPGLRTDISPGAMERQVGRVGCVVAAQTDTIVPADGAMYALRDASATVGSIPLIAASVMSKKLAVLSDLVMLDVKMGSGAFMKTPEGAADLARKCVELAAGYGRRAKVAVSDMSQPLGESIGNALDVAEAVEVLRGEHTGRLRELAVIFAAEAAAPLLGIERAEAGDRAERAIADGSAAEAFRAMVEAQGGDPRVVDDPRGILPRAPLRRFVISDRAGFLERVDAEELGRASAALGAGRRRKGDPVDPAVGIVFDPKVGDRIEKGQQVGVVHARTEDDAQRADDRVLAALTMSDQPVEPLPLIHGWHSTDDVTETAG